MQLSFSAVVQVAVAYPEPSYGGVVLPTKPSFPFLLEYIVVPNEAITNDKLSTSLNFGDFIAWNGARPSYIGPKDISASNDESFRHCKFNRWGECNGNSSHDLWLAVNTANLRWSFPMVAAISDDFRRNLLSKMFWHWLNVDKDISTFDGPHRNGRCEGGIGSFSHEPQLPKEQSYLPHSGSKHAEGEDGLPAGIGDQALIERRFFLALGCIFLSVLLALLGRYIAFEKDRLVFGTALICSSFPFAGGGFLIFLLA